MVSLWFDNGVRHALDTTIISHPRNSKKADLAINSTLLPAHVLVTMSLLIDYETANIRKYLVCVLSCLELSLLHELELS